MHGLRLMLGLIICFVLKLYTTVSQSLGLSVILKAELTLQLGLGAGLKSGLGLDAGRIEDD